MKVRAFPPIGAKAHDFDAHPPAPTGAGGWRVFDGAGSARATKFERVPARADETSAMARWAANPHRGLANGQENLRFSKNFKQ